MGISKLAVRRPVAIVMATLIIIILGYVSMTKLPIDLLPDLEIPVVVVVTNYSGVAPQEIEKLVTIPVEGAVATVSNIKEVRSTSTEGSSVVIAEFNFGADMDMAASDMREKIDLIKAYLPDDVEDPMVVKIDPNAMPIIQVSLTGNADLGQLQIFAEDIIKPRLERLEGVASVDFYGGYDKLIEISVNQQVLQGYGLSMDSLAQLIAAENINLPGGQLRKGSQELSIRTVGEFQSIEEIKQLQIPLRSGSTVMLGEIADVVLKNDDEGAVISRVNHERCIITSVKKQSGTNTVAVSDAVNAELTALAEAYPDVQFTMVLDQADYIQKSIDNLVDNALMGSLLAILVLYIFFRNVRTTLVIGISIPISIIASFVLLYFNNITLNLMTLGGMALAVGMLVDNAIVVLENIYRLRQEGLSRAEAAIHGAGEVALAVTASTLTTVAVFLPIVFVEGITSEIFTELALTVTLTLFASLAVSLTLIPTLSSKLLKLENGEKATVNKHKRFTGFIFVYFDRFFNTVKQKYGRLLVSSMNHRKRTIVIGIIVFIICLASLSTVGSEFFPEMDQGQFSIDIALPPGSEQIETEPIAGKIEAYLATIPEVDIIYSEVREDTASMTVLTKKINSQSPGTSVIGDQVRTYVKDIPGADIQVSVASGMGMMMGGLSNAPISINVKGDDLDTLKQIGEDFKASISQIEGTRMVESSLDEAVPEVQVNIDRNKAGRYGLTAAQIAMSVRTSMNGTIATRYKLDSDEIDVVLKGDDRYQESMANFEQLLLTTPAGIMVPLSQVAEVSIERGPQTISREGQARVINVTCQIFGRDLGSIAKDVETVLSEYEMPPGYIYEIGGENKEMQDAFIDLSKALLLAIVLVYMILAAQFESFLYPFVIMFAIPLAFSGGALGLSLTRKALSVPSLIGFIVLAGIVVNDAIVLIDYINTRRKSGEDRLTAIINAGPIRLRPILITTFTTVLGLLPLAIGIGEGAEALSPMAIVVIFGLTLATFLTLVFIPVLYSLFDDLAIKAKAKFSK